MSDNVSQRTQVLLPEQTEPALLPRAGAGIILSNAVLAEQCLLELDASRRGEPYTQTAGLELFRRATREGDLEAREWVQRCFGDTVLGWLHRHPSCATACRLESEENFVALTFEHFWQAIASTQQVSFRMLRVPLQYLRICFYGVVLETLRVSSRPKEFSLQGMNERRVEDQTESLKVWETLQTVLPHPRERRLAYLLYHCGLTPKEIAQFCPQEWSNVQEIYHLRRTILDMFIHNADQFGPVLPRLLQRAKEQG